MIYAGEIWKHSFISTVRPTDHTNPSQKRSFSKTIFKPEEFENETLSFRFRVDEKHFDNGAFLKQCRWMRFQIETSMFKFLRHGVDGEQKDNFSLSWRLPFPFLFFTVLIATWTLFLLRKWNGKQVFHRCYQTMYTALKTRSWALLFKRLISLPTDQSPFSGISIEKTNGWLSIRRIASSIPRKTRTCYCLRDPISTAAVAKAKLFVLIYPMTLKSQWLKTEKNVHGTINNE